MSEHERAIESKAIERLRVMGLLAVVIGAVGSMALTLRMGHRNRSGLLVAMFVVWGMSPYVWLAVCDINAKRWSTLARATLYGVMLFVTVASLAIYAAVVFGPPRPQPAFAFIVVPPAAWLVIAIAIPVAVLRSRGLSR